MSARGSFTTEILWCATCHAAVGAVLRRMLAHGDVVVREVLFPHPQFHRGLWCGIVTGLYAGEEIDVFDHHVNPALGAAICHPLQLVVFAESGASQVWTLRPTGGNHRG